MEFSGDGTSPGEIEVNSTILEDEVFTIEAYTSGYDIYFELSVEEATISGSMMGMFNIKGTRIK